MYASKEGLVLPTGSQVSVVIGIGNGLKLSTGEYSRATTMRSYDVILHPTDFSEDSDQAFQLSCNMARDEFATLVVVHVLPAECRQNCQQEVDLNEDHSPLIENCRQQFARMKSLACDIPVQFRLAFGNTVNSILKVACEVNAEVLVIASHRHAQSHIQLHGSIAEGILRQSHCPVIMLRQPQNNYTRHQPKQIPVQQTED